MTGDKTDVHVSGSTGGPLRIEITHSHALGTFELLLLVFFLVSTFVPAWLP